MAGKSGSEIWKAIPGFKGYEASDRGRVRSIDRVIMVNLHGRGILFPVRRRGQILKPQWSGEGNKSRLHVALGKGNQLGVHQVVMLAFVGPPPIGMEVAHNNGKPDDNRLSNLRYDTPVGNQADRLKHGTHMRGRRHPSAILTRQAVLKIRASKLPYRVLAQMYGVSRSGIKNVRNRRAWAWLK